MRPLFLRGRNGRRLELDGYCQPLLLAFEYNGPQHYEADHDFNRFNDGAFDEQTSRDRQKRAQCKSHGVRLIVVPYTVDDPWSFIRLSLLR